MTPSPSHAASSAVASFAQSARGDVRVGPLAALPNLITELGGSPKAVFARAGVSLQKFRDPDARVNMDRLGALIEIAAATTRRPDIGMLLGLRFDINGLGPVGELMQHSATVGDALRSIVLHLHLQDRGAAPVLIAMDPSTTLMGYAVHRFGTPALDLVYDASTGIIYRILTTLCGLTFRPKAIHASAGGRARAKMYQRQFGCRVRFDSGIAGVVFGSRWLARSIPGADPSRHVELQNAFAEAEAKSGLAFSQRVEIVLLQMLLAGTASGPAIAALFGISERTLRRRLKVEHLTLRDMVNRARFEQARQMLRHTDLAVGEIASVLQYQDVNAFSRAFRSWAGCAPTKWRANAPRGDASG